MSVSLDKITGVSLVKANPIVRAGRVYTDGSRLIAYTDVVEHADGSVWLVTHRRPAEPFMDGSLIRRERAYGLWATILAGKEEFERKGGFLSGTRILRPVPWVAA